MVFERTWKKISIFDKNADVKSIEILNYSKAFLELIKATLKRYTD